LNHVFEVRRVVVTKNADGSARGTTTGDDGSVVERIGKDEVSWTDKGRKSCGVGGVSHGEDEAIGFTDECCKFGFELTMEMSLAEFHGKRRSADAVGLDSGFDLRVAGTVCKAEVVVRGEIDNFDVFVEESKGTVFDGLTTLSFTKLNADGRTWRTEDGTFEETTNSPEITTKEPIIFP